MESFDRRKFLVGTSAAAGLAGAMTLLPGALPAFASAAGAAGPDRDRSDEPVAAEHDTDAPVLAHVRDLSSGEIEIFVGERQYTIRDPQLAHRIAGAAR